MASPPPAELRSLSPRVEQRAADVDTKETEAAAHVAAGRLLFEHGLFERARDEFKAAFALCPELDAAREGLALAQTEIGTRLKLCGQNEAGLEMYRQALKADENYAPAHYNLGLIEFEAGRHDEALQHYNRAAALNPAYAEPHCNIGVIHKLRNKNRLAVEAYERCLGRAPNFATARSNIAIALTHLAAEVKASGQREECIKLLERALAYNGQMAEALYYLGVAWGEATDFNRAIFFFELCVHFCPSCAEAYNYLGIIYKEMGNFELAMTNFQTAVRLKPTLHQALNNLGVLFTMQGKVKEALELLQGAIAVCPTHPESHNDLGVLLRDAGDVKGAIAAYEACLRVCPNSRSAGQNRLYALNYIHPGESARVCEAHAAWGEEFQKQVAPLPKRTDLRLDPERKLTVGYISPDFFTHSVSYFIEAPITHHRKEVVNIVYYCTAPYPDARTRFLREKAEAAGAVWKDVSKLSEEVIARTVREDGVDILVELTGHTAHNKLGVLAHRPAPIQVTWLGYPNSTGLRACDYRFVDSTSDPETTTQTHVEQLVRLPGGSAWCYTMSHALGPVNALPALRGNGVTFGSFNALAKMTPQVLALWARILREIPNSRLLIKGKPFACPHMADHFRSVLTGEGVEASRITLIPLEAATRNHLSKYNEMDISLDPFPYAGTTTTCEALSMGIPCITLRGRCHAHNVGASLMRTLGLTDWIAEDEDEYVDIAKRKAADLAGLAELRRGLRDRMRNSRLCDGPTFTKGLEGVYQSLWRTFCRKEERGQGKEAALEGAASGTMASTRATRGADSSTKTDVDLLSAKVRRTLPG